MEKGFAGEWELDDDIMVLLIGVGNVSLLEGARRERGAPNW
jgi:hypothetical protein